MESMPGRRGPCAVEVRAQRFEVPPLLLFGDDEICSLVRRWIQLPDRRCITRRTRNRKCVYLRQSVAVALGAARSQRNLNRRFDENRTICSLTRALAFAEAVALIVSEHALFFRDQPSRLRFSHEKLPTDLAHLQRCSFEPTVIRLEPAVIRLGSALTVIFKHPNLDLRGERGRMQLPLRID